MQRTEVRIGGFGGQGVVLAGVLLGQAALNDGRYAVQNQSYGAEARGGAARSEVIIADATIIYPEVVAPDIMVVLSQAALDRYQADFPANGTLIADEELVSEIPELPRARILRCPFTEVAGNELKRPITANMVMLGYMARATGVVGVESLETAVGDGVPAGTEDVNLTALRRGMALAGDLAAP